MRGRDRWAYLTDTGEMTGTVVTETAATGTAVERNYDESKLAAVEMGNTHRQWRRKRIGGQGISESAGQDEDLQAYRVLWLNTI